MSYGEAIKAALWSLWANPLRSFLTLLGIIIGITAIIAVVAIINGLNLFVAENLSNLGPGVFVINRYGLIANREDRIKAIRRNKKLKIADARAISEYANLAKVVACEVHATTPVRFRNQYVYDVDIGGITPEILEIEPYDIAAGRIITGPEQERAAPVAFIGFEVADKLFGQLSPIGRHIHIRGRRFEVIGVAAEKGAIMGFSRDIFIKIPISTHQKIFGARRSINISVKVDDLAALAAAQDQCRATLRARHHLDYNDDDDFGMYSADGLNDLWHDLTRILFNVALFVVGLSLIVGGIVIMNIMLVSVIERTREIGLRKAVGATQRDIKLQFLIEAVVLSCCGGLIGVALAFVISWLIKTCTPLPAAFPLWAPFLAVGISTVIGIFFGLQPAAKAAELDPITALHWEQ